MGLKLMEDGCGLVMGANDKVKPEVKGYGKDMAE